MEVYLQLLTKTTHGALSIKEITVAANVSRTTFYHYFADKDALWGAVKEKIYALFLSYYESANRTSDRIVTFTLCEHIFKYRTFYERVFHDAYEIQQLSNLLAEKLYVTFQDKDYATFASYGTIGYLSIWVQQYFIISPQEAGERLLKIGGTNWSFENFTASLL
ncbi:TetR/AcrR family transcriptional regulator [Caryophanon tenue]|uniref:HTH tetR-type domain-containing protein n=1 Tax=Caryophanon tenue TaxID=33978 RepID=A0A1C0YBV2_9BACL|nr:TetR/AcrR family transcriptional regulator [Caryophanon tenue]OCS84615.1 hypothetical protein A6M13_03290 [Caryophanon tenue]